MHALRCLNDAAPKYRALIDEADRLAQAYEPVPQPLDPWEELQRRLPHMLATFSPAARAMLREHCDHTCAMVAALDEVIPGHRLRLVSSS